jgi:hypothetical protein
MVELRGTPGSWSAPDASGRVSGDSFDAGGIVAAQRLLEAMDGHCVLVLDGQGRLTAASDRAVEVLGERTRTMVGHSPARVLSHSYVFETLLALAATMSPVEHHDDVILDGGDTVGAVVSASALGPAGETPRGYVLLFCVGAPRVTSASGNGHGRATRFTPGPPGRADRYREAARRAADEILAARVALASAVPMHMSPQPIDRAVAEAWARLDDTIHALSSCLLETPGGSRPGVRQRTRG